MAVHSGNNFTISSSAFIIAFQVNRRVFEYAVGLSKLFQGSTQDVLQVYEEVTNCRCGVQTVERDLQDDCRDGQHCWDSESDLDIKAL